MEHFIYNDDEFMSDIGDLLSHLELEEEDVIALPDDYNVTCENTDLEPMFVFNHDRFVDFLSDIYADRFPEESDSTFTKIESAIKQSFDIEKFNSLIPQLYYPNGKMFTVTKNDLLEYLSLIHISEPTRPY